MEATDFYDSSRAEGRTERNEFLYDVLSREREKGGVEKLESSFFLLISLLVSLL